MQKKRPQPYVYFDSRSYAGSDSTQVDQLDPVYPPLAFLPTPSIQGFSRPYRSDKARRVQGPNDPDQVPFEWMNKDTFQIMAAGLDEDYGANNVHKQFPSGVNFNRGDQNVIANFSDGLLKDGIK